MAISYRIRMINRELHQELLAAAEESPPTP